MRHHTRMRDRINKRLPIEFVQEVLESFNEHRISEKEAMDLLGVKRSRLHSSRQESSATVGRSLFSPLPPAFAVVPQYLFHVPVDLLPLSEPDKRLSHTSGSSASPSVCLRSTTRIQVFAEPGFRPLRPGQSLFEVCPGICPALTLAVEPFE